MAAATDRRPVVGILGGSFSPPHVGHVGAAAEALRLGGLDGVVVIPAFAHAFGKGLAPFGHRLAMARVAFSPLGPRVMVTSLERLLPRPSYTINTLGVLADAWPGVDWRLIIGSDVAGELPLWHQSAELVRRAPPLIFNRAGSAHQLPPDDPRLLAGGQWVVPEVSSTEIRDALRTGNLVRAGELLPTGVLGYLQRHRLQSLISGDGP
jgi:nicotinate-nucleotide adenylyltransferase